MDIIKNFLSTFLPPTNSQRKYTTNHGQNVINSIIKIFKKHGNIVINDISVYESFNNCSYQLMSVRSNYNPDLKKNYISYDKKDGYAAIIGKKMVQEFYINIPPKRLKELLLTLTTLPEHTSQDKKDQQNKDIKLLNDFFNTTNI